VTRKENVALIKKIIQERIHATKAFSELIYFLKGKGVSGSVVETLIEEMKHFQGQKEWLVILNELLARKIKTSGGFSFTKHPKKIALVGPTGVGKTTVCLKLADLYRRKMKVALLSLDCEKGGAFAQLEQHATKWSLPIFRQISELNDQTFDLLLIDTSGCNTYEAGGVFKLGKMLSVIPETEVHLILSAAAKEVDLYGAIHQFSALNCQSILMTKWDETLTSGVVANFGEKVDLPISYMAYGYPLPGKIEPAHSTEIAHKILTDLNSEHYQFLRRLANSQLY
jgi:flagellar biosynthesis protein FlhF